MSAPDYWNHNVHYQPVILAAVPHGCKAALDVGCGDGMLVRKLADRCAEVTGVDKNAHMIALARERMSKIVNASLIEADFLTYPFKDDSFDFVCANTSLHHMDFGEALTKLVRLLRPGGQLAVVGLAKDKSPKDMLTSAACLPLVLSYRMTRKKGGPGGVPIADPDMSWGEVRAAAKQMLPGARYRRHMMWRYSLLWRKPG